MRCSMFYFSAKADWICLISSATANFPSHSGNWRLPRWQAPTILRRPIALAKSCQPRSPTPPWHTAQARNAIGKRSNEQMPVGILQQSSAPEVKKAANLEEKQRWRYFLVGIYHINSNENWTDSQRMLQNSSSVLFDSNILMSPRGGGSRSLIKNIFLTESMLIWLKWASRITASMILWCIGGWVTNIKQVLSIHYSVKRQIPNIYPVPKPSAPAEAESITGRQPNKGPLTYDPVRDV